MPELNLAIIPERLSAEKPGNTIAFRKLAQPRKSSPFVAIGSCLNTELQLKNWKSNKN